MACFYIIKNSRFLLLEIPLPPLTEQQRILARLEVLAARIESARRLRQEAGEEAEALVDTKISEMFNTESANWRPYKLGDLAKEMCYGTSAKAYNETDGIPVL